MITLESFHVQSVLSEIHTSETIALCLAIVINFMHCQKFIVHYDVGSQFLVNNVVSS